MLTYNWLAPGPSTPRKRWRVGALVTVRLGDLKIDNIRKSPTEGASDGETPSVRRDFAALVESVKARGVLQPPGVSIKTLTVVYGERRIAAVDVLCDRHDVPPSQRLVRVKLCEQAPRDRRTDQLVENLHRRDLRPHEIALGVADLRGRRMTYMQIAEQLTLSRSYVALLGQIREKACPAVWERFERVGFAIPARALAELCKLPAEDQLAAWEQATGAAPRRSPGRASWAKRWRDAASALESEEAAGWSRDKRAGYRLAIERVAAEASP